MSQTEPGATQPETTGPTSTGPASAGPLRTGIAEVDAVLDAVETLDAHPVADHPAAFEAAHEQLRRSLDATG